MTDYRSLDVTSEKIFEKTLLKIQGKVEIRRKDSSAGLKLLSKFDELKIYKSLFVHKVTELRGENGSFIILLAEKHLTIIVQKSKVRFEKDIEEIEPMLIFSVPQSMGKVFIRKETIGDKINDLLSSEDIDFKDYPKFSKRYYVVGENPELVKSSLPKNLIEALEETKDLIVEINGNWGLVRTEKNLSEEVLRTLINLGHTITNQ